MPKKLLLSFLKILLLSYSLLMAIAWGLSDSLIFLPPKSSYENAEPFIFIQSNTHGSDSTHTIVADYKIQPSAKYTVLYNHGNAVDLAGLQNLKQRFYNHGYSVIIYDYSGYGLSSGKPSEQQVYNDSQAIYEYLINHHNLDPKQIILYGHSLGSAIATNLAQHNPAGFLILESPFTTAFRVKTRFPIIPFDKFNSLEKLPDIHIPVLILHSYDDNIIPLAHSKQLFNASNLPKESLWFNHAGHNAITQQGDRFWQPLKTFINTYND